MQGHVDKIRKGTLEWAGTIVQTSHGGQVTILWHQQIQTDINILNNKPDIIIHDNEK
jgi:hypothetical protein